MSAHIPLVSGDPGRNASVRCCTSGPTRRRFHHDGFVVRMAIEGRVFVLFACQTIAKDAYPADYEFEFEIGNNVMRGGSMIVNPLGNVLACPVFDEETILHADAELSKRTESHLDMDITGNYTRPDVFSLSVDTKAKNSVEFYGHVNA
ncbi:nitrilase-related carbon-nitrogen hydrolase [Arthrobacter sp. TS-15]|uniref:nitrilase-related carbon-nitrogen hydrolase n=1 Tax=Arthrobacter sp. TS-15 TaxID=2510797 RepID=UPI00237B4CA9|nr:nitrilase-related carbon-nitrogen hydrolase [Arthrobacter sp. TS-15]